MAGRQVKSERILHRGPSEHDASHWKKLILILSIHTRHHGSAPLSLVVPKTAFNCWFGLLRKLHFAIMKQSACVSTANVKGRKCVSVLVYMHTLAACIVVHLVTCIKAIKALLLDFSFKLLELKIKSCLYLHRISYSLVSSACFQKCNAPQTSHLTSEELSITDPKSFQAEHMTDLICVLADSCFIVKHWLSIAMHLLIL